MLNRHTLFGMMQKNYCGDIFLKENPRGEVMVEKTHRFFLYMKTFLWICLALKKRPLSKARVRNR